MLSFRPEIVPADILPHIFEELSDRRDLHAAALTSHAFHIAATPVALLKIDSSISLTVFSYTTDRILLKFLAVIRGLPVQELVVRSYSDLGEAVWSLLTQIRGLKKVAIWCMEGPPRVLQGWADKLGDTLTHLELGVPLLKELRLRGAPSSSIPTLLAYLPNLETLDTEFISSGISRSTSALLPRLKNLTVRTSSMNSADPDAQKLWYWITILTPHASLESFTLNAFSVQGHTDVPRSFLSGMADTHGPTLTKFMVDTCQLTLGEIKNICARFPKLEHLACSVVSSHVVRKLTSYLLAKQPG
ncbi:hypothetical protein HWV62_6855 [Athelia sp. TMB]|nr:hypothetical protein HWV62_6855 [Athelia sp. TMB]